MADINKFDATNTVLDALKQNGTHCKCHEMNQYGMGSDLHTFGQALWNMNEADGTCFALEKGWIWDPIGRVFTFKLTDRCSAPQEWTQGRHTGKFKAAIRRTATAFILSNYLSDHVYQEARDSVHVLKGATVTNMVTVHVRWGDKHNEAPQIPITKYVKAVADFQITHPVVYITTEDKSALREFTRAAPKNWTVRHYAPATSTLSTGPNNSPMNFARSNPNAGMHSMVAFLLGMQGNNFVLTTSSNWSRLFREMCAVRHSNPCTITDLSNNPDSW